MRMFWLLASVLFLFLSGCTAQGQLPPPTFDIALLTLPLLAAISILALAYMASAIFGLHHWVPIIGDEIVQVLATGIVALLLIGSQSIVDGYLSSALGAIDPLAAGGINAYASGLLSSLQADAPFSQVQAASIEIGQQASRGIYCSMMGVGFTLSNCGQLNAFRGSLTAAGFTALAGMLDIYAQQAILSFAARYAFTLVIPLGLFFRCFKMSRPAGGALIAIGFGFYSAYPLAIAGSTKLLTGMSEPLMLEPPLSAVPKLSDAQDPVPKVCDPYETDSSIPRKQFNEYAASLTSPEVAQGLTYFVIVKVVFLSILSLILTLGFIREIAKLLGSEIDVSSLARIT